MISFNEWLKIITEESAQERMTREAEALTRAERWDDYAQKAKNHSANKPGGPIGSPEWVDHARNAPSSPTEEFREKVDEEIFRLTGLSWNNGEIIDNLTAGKQEADLDRVSSLIEDSWDDGSSPQETAKMAVELMKSMGYLK
jgi:hypothetical protein